MSDYIPLAQCEHRKIYRIASRNLSVGVFDEVRRGFIGIREKFGDYYLFMEFHYDTGAPHGTARPLESVGQVPDSIPLRENLDTIDNVTKRLVAFDYQRDADNDKAKGWYFLDTDPREYSRDIRPVAPGNKELFDLLGTLTPRRGDL